MLTAAATRRVFCLANVSKWLCSGIIVVRLYPDNPLRAPQSFCAKELGAITTLGCRWLRGRGGA